MIEAINAGQIPPAFQEHLQARANELVNTVNCPAPTNQGETTEEKKPKKEKKKKDEEEEPVPTTTEPLPTITEDDQ